MKTDQPATTMSTTTSVRRGELTCRQAVENAINAAHRHAPLNAFVELWEEPARRRADELDRLIASGATPPPLAGVVFGVKANICTTLGRTTCASRMLADYRSPFEATAVRRLREAGAIPIGSLNMDEFGMGSSGENSAHGPTLNPWDRTRVPGGSSSGGAAAVAAGILPLALGSDTGGSIRQPAAMCGVVGIKPTYGRVSRLGLVAYASSLDQIGPITPDVHSAAVALTHLCGFDPDDATSADLPVPDFTRDLLADPGPVRIAVPRQARLGSNHPDVSAAFDRSLDSLRQDGAQIVDVDMPMLDAAVNAYYIVATAEASSNLARYDGVRYGRRAPNATSLEEVYTRSRTEGFGAEVQRRIMLGTHVLSAGYADEFYLTALRARRVIKQEFDAAFAMGCRAVAMPTAPNPAFRLGEKAADPASMYLEDVYTVGVNLAGLPAISVPMGLSTSTGTALPLGLQLIGPAFEESAILNLAARFEARVGRWSPPA
jgi:aspartyl-tRNA(Asn)/glutamyl-tRNA(Gln) amidotransferase subunit A